MASETKPISVQVFGGTRGGRYEKSLGLLTTKFVSLLRQAKDGVLDLKEAADALGVSRRTRRIYDITNALEGIGLIEKKSKNAFQWKGAGAGTNTEEFVARVEKLQDEVRELDSIEKRIDTHRQWLEQSLRNVTEDPVNRTYAYIRQDDICVGFADPTILAVKMPRDAQMDIPPGEIVGDAAKYKIHLKGGKGPITSYLVNPELEAPGIMVDFPEKHRKYVEEYNKTRKAKEAIHEAETQPLIKEFIATTITSPEVRSQVGCSPGSSSLGNESPTRRRGGGGAGIRSRGSSSTSIFSTRRQAAKRRASETTIAEEDDDLLRELPDGFATTSMIGPIIRLSPPPTEQDYRFTLANHEGLIELFDIKKPEPNTSQYIIGL